MFCNNSKKNNQMDKKDYKKTFNGEDDENNKENSLDDTYIGYLKQMKFINNCDPEETSKMNQKLMNIHTCLDKNEPFEYKNSDVLYSNQINYQNQTRSNWNISSHESSNRFSTERCDNDHLHTNWNISSHENVNKSQSERFNNEQSQRNWNLFQHESANRLQSERCDNEQIHAKWNLYSREKADNLTEDKCNNEQINANWNLYSRPKVDNSTEDKCNNEQLLPNWNMLSNESVKKLQSERCDNDHLHANCNVFSHEGSNRLLTESCSDFHNVPSEEMLEDQINKITKTRQKPKKEPYEDHVSRTFYTKKPRKQKFNKKFLNAMHRSWQDSNDFMTANQHHPNNIYFQNHPSLNYNPYNVYPPQNNVYQNPEQLYFQNYLNASNSYDDKFTRSNDQMKLNHLDVFANQSFHQPTKYTDNISSKSSYSHEENDENKKIEMFDEEDDCKRKGDDVAQEDYDDCYIYSCDPCMKKFKRLSTLKIHIFSHLKDAFIYACPKSSCNNGFKSQAIAIRHINYYHRLDKQELIENLKRSKYICIFRSYTTLIDYFNIFCSNIKNPFIDSFCFGCFTYPRSMKEHPCNKLFYCLTICPSCRREVGNNMLKTHVHSKECKRTMPTRLNDRALYR